MSRTLTPAGSGTVVGYLQLDLGITVVDLHPGAGRAGVLEGVGERLLNYPVGGEVHTGRQGSDIPFDAQFDGQTGLACLLDQGVQVLEAGLRGKSKLRIGAPQDAGQPAQLRERLASGRLNRGECLPGFLLLTLEQTLGRLRLHDHHAHAVRHHIVKLA